MTGGCSDSDLTKRKDLVSIPLNSQRGKSRCYIRYEICIGPWTESGAQKHFINRLTDH